MTDYLVVISTDGCSNQIPVSWAVHLRPAGLGPGCVKTQGLVK
ncbi:hypothetical protein ACH50O_12315 [Methylomonas sp. 2BW1-5-20]